jgi:hypothetical protein
MALVECKECKTQISSEAKACPKCGAAPPKPTSRLTILIAGLFLFFILKSIFGVNSSGPSTAQSKPAPSAADVKKEADFQQVVNAARWVKKSVKNPKSFELEYAGYTDGGTVCIKYRATNSFNAIVPGVYVMSNTVSGDTAALWNKHCSGHPITDFTHARQAL